MQIIQTAVMSSILSPKILLSSLFSKTYNVRPFFRETDQVSCPFINNVCNTKTSNGSINPWRAEEINSPQKTQLKYAADGNWQFLMTDEQLSISALIFKQIPFQNTK